jgi:hypothetical protein
MSSVFPDFRATVTEVILCKTSIGHLQPETAVTFLRNGRSPSTGSSGQIQPEYSLI